jgi:hypothetical protein
MLCGISVAINSVGDVLGLVSYQRGSEDRQVLVGFQSTEAFDRFQHAGGRPAQCHRSIAPALHVATDAAHGAHHVLDRVGAGQRAPQWHRQLEADDGQYLVEPFENAGSDARRLLVEPAGEIVAFDPGRASAPRIAVPHMLPSSE